MAIAARGMKFDVNTLYLTNVAVLLVTAFMALLYWLRNREQVAVLVWAAATALGGVGTLVIGVFGPVPHMDPSIVGNTLIVAGVVLAWESMRRFNDRPAAPRRVAACVLAFLVVFATAWALSADLRVRVFLGSLALAGFAFLASREIAAGGRQDPVSGRATTALIFGIVALDMAIRAAHAALGPPVDRELAFFEDPVQGHTMFAMTIGLVCLSVSGLSTMSHERLLHRYERLALTDELTGLPNRRFFDENAPRLVRRAQRDGKPVSLLVMDLDHFSDINERVGHSGGDRVLAAFAEALRAHVRPTDIVCRYGGEEFCALLVDVRLEQAVAAAGRLRTAVAGLAVEIGGRPVAFTVSIGVASLVGDDLAGALERADQALYRAKHAGRNRVAAAADEAAA
jgi:diguanylate cyclase (GGDEF)-like protein